MNCLPFINLNTSEEKSEKICKENVFISEKLFDNFLEVLRSRSHSIHPDSNRTQWNSSSGELHTEQGANPIR